MCLSGILSGILSGLLSWPLQRCQQQWGTRTGHYEDRSGTGCGRRFSTAAEMSWVVSAPLPHARSEGEGLCHARISPVPGGFTASCSGSKVALRGCMCPGWDPLAPAQHPAAVRRPHGVWGMWGLSPSQEPPEGDEAHSLPSWKREGR